MKCTSISAVLAAMLPITFFGSLSSAQPMDENAAPASTTNTLNGRPARPVLRLRIAVDQFKWDEIRAEQWPIPRDVREGLQAILVDKLRASGRFQVMEREATTLQQGRVEDQIDEIKRQGQKEDGEPPTPVRPRRTPARYILTPTVTGFQETGGGKRGIKIFGQSMNLGDKEKEITLSLNVRISDAGTSSIIETATAEGKQKSKSSNIGIKLGPLELGNEAAKQTPFSQVVDKALNIAVAKIVARLDKEPWSALVMGQDEETRRVLVNSGSDAGLEAGQEFDIFKSGRIFRDPETGDTLGRGDETKIGRIRIFRVEREMAFGDVVEGKSFEPRNVVRIGK